MIRVEDLQVFVRAAQTGSFSAAARELDLSPALASSNVKRLERELGFRLFVRSTRSMRLSDDGQRYLPYAEDALRAIESGEQALKAGRGEVSGTLRLSLPSDLGRNLVMGWLDEFLAAHPALSLHLSLGDQTVDLFRQSLDAGIRYGLLADSSLVSLPLAPENRRLLCASPAYLKRHGRPREPADLKHHNCLRFVLGDQTHERWSFHTPAGVEIVAVNGDRVCNDAEVVHRWGVAGQGIVYKSSLDLAEDVRAGRLETIFPLDWGEPAPLQMVCAHRSLLTPAIQQLREHLFEHCVRHAL
jgi:DNA-binding transcriptional LysR family regulator